MKKIKESRNIYDSAITYENIYNIWKIVRRTCKNKKAVFYFSLNLHSNLMNIYNVLKNKSYHPSNYRTFMIFEPKPRLVMSQSVFDKIINHFVTNYYLTPYLEKSLLDMNVATRRNKGSNYAMNLIKKYCNKIYINEKTSEIYCLKIDISKYFYSIDHNILIEKLKYYLLDEDVIDLIKRIISETNNDYINQNIIKYNKIYNTDIPLYENNKGLSIGAMTSQFLAIFFLNDLDHFIVEKLNCKYSVRYMDDLFILDTDKEKLKMVWNKVEEELAKINLKINRKSNIYRMSKGINFLGFNYKFCHNKLSISYKKETFIKISKRLKLLENINLYKYKKSLASYYGYFKTVNSSLKKENFKINDIELYYYYKEMYPNIFLLIKNNIFYKTFNEDANKLSELLDYNNCFTNISFKDNLYNQITDILINKSIKFSVIDLEMKYF